MKLNEKITNVDYTNNHICLDANLAVETGGYYTNANTTNLPIDNSAGYLDVKFHADGNLTQFWTRYRDNQVFIRHCNPVAPSGWKEWQEIGRKSAITLQLTSNQTIRTGYSVIQFNNTDTQIGNGLTVSSTGVIKIGAGISNVKVSFYLNLSNSANPQVPIVHILKNGSNLQQSGASIVGTTNSNFPLTIANYLVEVEENDLISIEIAGNSANITIRTGSFMTVESI